jgi:hypothetical protein
MYNYYCEQDNVTICCEKKIFSNKELKKEHTPAYYHATYKSHPVIYTKGHLYPVKDTPVDNCPLYFKVLLLSFTDMRPLFYLVLLSI